MTNLIKKLAIVAILSPALVACAGSKLVLESQGEASKAIVSPMRPIAQSQDSQKLLACVKATGVLKGLRIGVEGIKDESNKANYAAQGATGGLLPGPSSGGHEIDKALRAMGAQTVNLYSTSGVRTLLEIGGATMAKAMGPSVFSSVPDIIIGGSYQSADYMAMQKVNLQFAGAGPNFSSSGVLLTTGLSIKTAGTGETVSAESGERFIPYIEGGFSGGKFWNTTLVTGEASAGVQGALQYGAVFGSLRNIAAATVLKMDDKPGSTKFKRAYAACAKELEAAFPRNPVTTQSPSDESPEGEPITVAGL